MTPELLKLVADVSGATGTWARITSGCWRLREVGGSPGLTVRSAGGGWALRRTRRPYWVFSGWAPRAEYLPALAHALEGADAGISIHGSDS